MYKCDSFNPIIAVSLCDYPKKTVFFRYIFYSFEFHTKKKRSFFSCNSDVMLWPESRDYRKYGDVRFNWYGNRYLGELSTGTSTNFSLYISFHFLANCISVSPLFLPRIIIFNCTFTLTSWTDWPLFYQWWY